MTPAIVAVDQLAIKVNKQVSLFISHQVLRNRRLEQTSLVLTSGINEFGTRNRRTGFEETPSLSHCLAREREGPQVDPWYR